MTDRASARGWIVTLAGLGINLALGVLYSWSIIAKALTAEWGWSAGQSSLPYATAVGTFALSMVFAGRAQDRFGPRIVATVGGVLTGVGLLVASYASATVAWPMIVGFGVLAGAGIGLGYASATPAAVKWFPPQRKGFITGLVVSGFGLASVYIAPLTTALIHGSGIGVTLRILGVSFFVAIIGLAQMLVNPPAGYVAPMKMSTASAKTKPVRRDLDWRDMVRTKQFVLLWIMYAFSAFAGLMIIGHMAKIAVAQLPGIDLGFGLVAVLAIGNAGGRVAAGTAADRFGETRTMFVVFVMQAIMMGAISFAHTPLSLIPVAAAVGFCYGANLALFPSATAGFFGTKHLGVNYGLVFTAWGVGGVFGSMTAGTIVDSTGSYAVAYVVAAGLCLLAAATTFITKAPDPLRAPVELKVKAHKTKAA
ncbi:MAG: oxalate:formate antiporter [Actinobacteria bacterium HGW-Actinobacteria-6]|jgi:OFA family oxalate/formate antiporter-like MFS transporter|nr:MAG: oxalate:formate antiporter [Actinobacteria bacterium HGW-Actinobacteria-6]